MKKINSKLFKEMLIGGTNNISLRVEEINELNVFPIPDGDTGTNMNVTVQSGKKAIENLKSSSTIEEIAATFSRSSLLAASGNSGVILSQFLKGISIGVQGKKELIEEDFVKIFNEAKTLAYQSVKNPVEGTILTLTKSLADHAKAHDFSKAKKSKTSIKTFFNEALSVIKETVEDTPNLLPVLKEANVVDSGAFGLGIFIEGMIKVYHGEKITSVKRKKSSPNIVHHGNEAGFCSDIIIKIPAKKVKKFKKEKLDKQIAKFCHSIAIVVDKEIIKIHTHTQKPDKLLNLSKKYGQVIKSKFTDMQNQINNNHLVSKKVKVDKAVIVVSSGQGLSKEFKKLGAHYIIDGGQGKNPATKDFVNAINSFDAKEYYIFVNNKNIFMSALASKLSFRRKKIYVVRTKTMWEGLNSLMQFVDDDNHKEIKADLKQIRKNSVTVEVTNAIKNSIFKNRKIKKDDFIAISNGKIIYSSKTKLELFTNIAEYFVKEEIDFVYIIVGHKTIGTQILTKTLEGKNIETNIIKGDQKIYSFIIGGEK